MCPYWGFPVLSFPASTPVCVCSSRTMPLDVTRPPVFVKPPVKDEPSFPARSPVWTMRPVTSTSGALSVIFSVGVDGYFPGASYGDGQRLSVEVDKRFWGNAEESADVEAVTHVKAAETPGNFGLRLSGLQRRTVLLREHGKPHIPRLGIDDDRRLSALEPKKRQLRNAHRDEGPSHRIRAGKSAEWPRHIPLRHPSQVSCRSPHAREAQCSTAD